MADSLSISQLQNYIKTKRSEYISVEKPSYEVLFFSRFNKTVDIIGDIVNKQQYSSTHPVPSLQSGTITPNARLTSVVNTVSREGVSIVQNINISNSVSNPDGSTGTITMLNPVGIDYFLPTIGTANKANTIGGTDYDYSLNLPIPQQRIGDMDIVIVRLGNGKPSFNGITGSDVIFRGVVRKIQRSESVQSGSMLTIHVADFSEYLRRINAIPLGFFSTVSFSLTGRQLTSNLLKFSNRLYTGDWNFLGQDVLGAFRQEAQSIDTAYFDKLGVSYNVQDVNNQAVIASQNHKMAIPPYLFLEFSANESQIKTPPSLDNATYNQDNGNKQAEISTTDLFKNLLSQSNGLTNFLKSGILNQTPEDNEILQTYQAAFNKQASNLVLNKTAVASNDDFNISKDIEKYAWVLSDIYLDKGIITFENQRIWPLMINAAHRAMREVYFDFSPKLAPNPTTPYIPATVPQMKGNKFPDLHPNIGVLKYRLSPCMKPYDENNSATTYVNQYAFSDDDVVSYDSIETEEDVYTAVFGFGSVLDNPAGLPEVQTNLLAGQSKGLLAFAQSIDPRLESRLGYRFMTDSDQKIRIPILMYLTSYVMLIQSQMNMFAAQIIITGNPNVKAGSIVRLITKNVDYYCADVAHSWSQGGYFTTLYLSYGHTAGILPAALTGGNAVDNVADNQQCQVRSQELNKFVSVNKNIGNVNAHCLISALWQFMSCASTTNDALKALSPEFENSAPKTTTYSDWIDYVKSGSLVSFCSQYTQFSAPAGFTPYPFDNLQHQIENEIQYQGLDKYGVTFNLIKNLVFQESSFCQNAFAQDGGVGMFQITPGTASRDIYNPSQSITYAIALLKQKFLAAGCQPNQFSPTLFLNAITRYNGLTHYTSVSYATGATEPYVNSVLGSQQVQDIVNGVKKPSNMKTYSAQTGVPLCQPGGAGQVAWPFAVYGPIGQRLDAYMALNKNATTASAKSTLLDYQNGMTAGVSYILYLMNKYKDAPLKGANNKNGAGSWVDNNNLISKIIGAWFSNEDLNSLTGNQSATLGKTINAIQQLYNACLNCTGILGNPSTNFDYTKNLALEKISFRCPVNFPIVTSKAGEWRKSGTNGPHFHEGVDWVSSNGSDICYAPASGIVVQKYSDPSDGESLIILHSDIHNGIGTRMFDMTRTTVQLGQSVNKGDIIGYMASPAQAPGESGSHLHCELRISMKVSISPPNVTGLGKWIDPLPYLK